MRIQCSCICMLCVYKRTCVPLETVDRVVWTVIVSCRLPHLQALQLIAEVVWVTVIVCATQQA